MRRPDWQRFLPGGPLALLPFADGSCSIVWSVPTDEAGQIEAQRRRATRHGENHRRGT